jgi:hypothetical protein
MLRVRADQAQSRKRPPFASVARCCWDKMPRSATLWKTLYRLTTKDNKVQRRSDAAQDETASRAGEGY